MKYIDADKLIAEIEGRIALIKGVNSKGDYAKGSIDADMGILEYITSLQQERPEVDLEEEINSYCGTRDIRPVPDFMDAVARHFYELGLNARKEE